MIGQAHSRTLPLDLVKFQKPNWVATTILDISAEVKNDRTEGVDHLKRDTEPLTSRWRRHLAPFETERCVARQRVSADPQVVRWSRSGRPAYIRNTAQTTRRYPPSSCTKAPCCAHPTAAPHAP